MRLAAEVKPCENHGLFRSRLVRSLHKIDSPTSDVQEEVFSLVYRLEWDFEAQRTEAVRIVVCTVLSQRQKKICFSLGQIDHQTAPSNQRIGPQNDKLARIRRGNRLSFREASVLKNIAPVGLDCRLCNRLEKGAPSAGSALLSCSLNRPTPAAGRTLLPLPGRSGAAGWAGFARKPTAASPCRTRPRWLWLSVRPASG